MSPKDNKYLKGTTVAGLTPIAQSAKANVDLNLEHGLIHITLDPEHLLRTKFETAEIVRTIGGYPDEEMEVWLKKYGIGAKGIKPHRDAKISPIDQFTRAD